MARRRTSAAPRRPAATCLDPDVYEHLRDLADLHGTSVSGLLRCAALMLIRGCGDELPESVAHLERVPFAGEVPSYAHERCQRTIEVAFDDDAHAALERIADAKNIGPARLIYDLVQRDVLMASMRGTRLLAN